jgi:hypothetical protein
MFIATTPPAIHAPACTPNEADPKVDFDSVPKVYSPDCRWVVETTVINTDKCYEWVSVYHAASKQRIYHICFDHGGGYIHWLSDRKTAIINGYNSDLNDVIVLTLSLHKSRRPYDLLGVFFPDYGRGSRQPENRFTYHIYPSFEKETPDGIDVSLREDDDGDKADDVVTRCLTYRFRKPDFRHYKLISRIGPVPMDKATCTGQAANGQ